MEAKLGFNGFRAYQVVYTKMIPAAEMQDCVVPDTLPDIGTVNYTSGSVLIRSKDVADGHIRLEANVPARVYCCGEGKGQRFCLDVNIPFYISAEDPAITDDCVCTAALKLRHLETRMLNPRKISVRAEISAELTCYEEENVVFSTAPEESRELIHTLEEEAELTAICGVSEKTFVLTDEYELPSDRDAVSEIIAQDADISIQETRSIGSKLILKGIVRSTLITATEEGTPEQLCFQTAFSQIIETETETEDALFDVRMLTSGMYYEPTPVSDGRSIAMELHLVAQTVMYKKQEVRYLADAYCNSYALQLTRQNREFLLFGRETELRSACTATIDTAGAVDSVLSCHVTPLEWSCSADEIAVQLLLRVFWRCGDGCGSAERTVTEKIKAEAGGEVLHIVDVSVADVFAAPSDGGIELRAQFELHAFTVNRTEAACIDRIEYDEASPLDLDDRPTLVILYPGFSGDLWTIAKENCSTVEAISAANAISDGVIHTDQLLLIPKSI